MKSMTIGWAFCSKEVIEESDGSRTRKVISNNGNWSCVEVRLRVQEVEQIVQSLVSK